MSGFALAWAVLSVSPGPDGERVGVVGEDPPLSPDLLALVAFEAAVAHPVAAFEVADASLLAGSVTLQAPIGASGARFLAARDEHPVGRELGQRLVRRAGHEPAIEGYLARGDPEPLKLRDGVGQQRVLARVARRGRRGQDQPARAALGVLGHFGQLSHVPELVGLAQLALADRPGVGV